MRYVKAEIILPDTLLQEIQKYVQGEYLYIPTLPGKRKKWGENSGNRAYIQERNKEILAKYDMGYAIANLAEAYFLSVESIKKIVYMRKK